MKKNILKDTYFDYNMRCGMDIAKNCDLASAETSLDNLISQIPDDKEREQMDSAAGILCTESEYKGFLLGLLAASQNSKLCKLLNCR